MKFLILVSSVMAVAMAGWTPSVYYGQHIPVIGPNGVPVETPEVQAAKADHFAVHAQASARTGHYGYLGAAPLEQADGVPGAVTHDGHPLDTPEVAAAKAQHYVDYALAAQRNGVNVAPTVQLGADGLPIDTPEVQAAKADHFAVHAQASARTGHYGYLGAAPLEQADGVPGAVTHDGHPLDTPEVAAAKAQHYVDYALAAQRNGVNVAPTVQLGADGLPIDTSEVQAAKAKHLVALAEAPVRSGAVVPVYYTAGYGSVPISSNGVPVDTPEVQAAKAHHFAAHAAARGGYAVTPYAGAWILQPHAVIGHDGQPVETPEVQLAKAAHFAAYSARQYYH